MMRKFSLKHRVIKIFRLLLRRNRSPPTYHRLQSSKPNTISKLLNRFKTICCNKLSPGYIPIRQDPVPKGQMAVYVGSKDGDYRRVLVPVIYINHPLFGQLLREAEEEYGFNHPGGITIPCRISEFERVKTRIQEEKL